MTEHATLDVDVNRYGSITEAIVTAAGAIRGERPTELEPLYGSVDPDALERLFASGRPVSVTFEYAGLSVSVADAETVRVSELDEAVGVASD